MLRGDAMTAKAKHTAEAWFFIPFPNEGYLQPVDDAAADGPFSDLARTFRQNLSAAASAASVPFHMAVASVHRRRFMQLNIAEQIRAREHLDEHGNVPEWAQKEAMEKASVRLRETSADLADPTLDELSSHLDDSNFASAARELLCQGDVLVWGALEVLASDLFVAVLNGDPQLTTTLLENETAKRLFGLKTFTVDALAGFRFDLSRHMGDVLVSHHPVDSIPTMKTVFGTLYPQDEDLRQALNTRNLFVLNQRRHLIVHRRALIDAEYVRLVGEGSVGDRLIVSPEQFEGDILAVRDAGRALLRSATSVFVQNDND